MISLRDHVISNLNWTRQCTEDIIGGFPEDKFTFQTTETDNHVLWTLGHLCLSDRWILGMVAGEEYEVPESYESLFGFQSKAVASAEAYPPPAELRKHFDEARRRLMAWLEQAGDEEITKAVDDGGMGFAKTALDALSKQMWHEGWHAGQIAPLRRALGLEPAFGPPEPPE